MTEAEQHKTFPRFRLCNRFISNYMMWILYYEDKWCDDKYYKSFTNILLIIYNIYNNSTSFYIINFRKCYKMNDKAHQATHGKEKYFPTILLTLGK